MGRAATQFEVALTRGGVLVDVSNLSSVTLEASPDENRDGGRVFSRTLAGSALDPSLTEATWADGTKQHALFTFSSAEMNVALGGAERGGFLAGRDRADHGGESARVRGGAVYDVDDGAFASALPPPSSPGAGLTLAQADLRYAQRRRCSTSRRGSRGKPAGAGRIWTGS